jgi:hypothetical protein
MIQQPAVLPDSKIEWRRWLSAFQTQHPEMEMQNFASAQVISSHVRAKYRAVNLRWHRRHRAHFAISWPDSMAQCFPRTGKHALCLQQEMKLPGRRDPSIDDRNSSARRALLFRERFFLHMVKGDDYINGCTPVLSI